MKAVVLTENAHLVCREVPLKEIPGWYRIRVAFAGICGSDIVRGFRNGAYHYPLIMGHEFSGVIEEAPEGGRYAAGLRAAIYPLLPCGKCEACEAGAIQQCEHYDYFGSRRPTLFRFRTMSRWKRRLFPSRRLWRGTRFIPMRSRITVLRW